MKKYMLKSKMILINLFTLFSLGILSANNIDKIENASTISNSNRLIVSEISSFINNSKNTDQYIYNFSSNENNLLNTANINPGIANVNANQGNILVNSPSGSGCNNSGGSNGNAPTSDLALFNSACSIINNFNTSNHDGIKAFVITGSLYIHSDLKEDHFKREELIATSMIYEEEDVMINVSKDKNLNTILREVYDSINISDPVVVFFAIETRRVTSFQNFEEEIQTFETDFNFTNFGYFFKGEIPNKEAREENVKQILEYANGFRFYNYGNVQPTSLALNKWLHKLCEKLATAYDNHSYFGILPSLQYSFINHPLAPFSNEEAYYETCNWESDEIEEANQGTNAWNELVSKFSSKLNEQHQLSEPTINQGIEKFVYVNSDYSEPKTKDGFLNGSPEYSQNLYKILEEKCLILSQEDDHIQFYVIIDELKFNETPYKIPFEERSDFAESVLAQSNFSADNAVIIIVPYTKSTAYDCFFSNEYMYKAYPYLISMGNVDGQAIVDFNTVDTQSKRVFEFVENAFREVRKPYRQFKYTITVDNKVMKHSVPAETKVKGKLFINEFIVYKHKRHDEYAQKINGCYKNHVLPIHISSTGFSNVSPERIAEMLIDINAKFDKCLTEVELLLEEIEATYSDDNKWEIDTVYATRVRERYIKDYHAEIIYKHYLTKNKFWVEATNAFEASDFAALFGLDNWDISPLPPNILYSYDAVHEIVYNIADAASVIPVAGAFVEGAAFVYATAAGHKLRAVEYGAGTILNLATSGFGSSAIRVVKNIDVASMVGTSGKFRAVVRGENSIDVAKTSNSIGGDLAPCLVGININPNNYANVAFSSSLFFACPFDTDPELIRQVEHLQQLLELTPNTNQAKQIAVKLANGDRAGAEELLKSFKNEEYLDSKGKKLLAQADNDFFSLAKKLADEFGIDDVGEASKLAAKLGYDKVQQLIAVKAAINTLGQSKKLAFLDDIASVSTSADDKIKALANNFLEALETKPDLIQGWKDVHPITFYRGANKRRHAIRFNTTFLEKYNNDLTPAQQNKMIDFLSTQSAPQGKKGLVNYDEVREVTGIGTVTIHYDEFGFPDFTGQYCAQPPSFFRVIADDLLGTPADFRKSNEKIAEKFGFNKPYPKGSDGKYLPLQSGNYEWIPYSNNFKLDEVKYTWHHHQDGKNIFPVQTRVHNTNTDGGKGFPHSGGDKLLKKDLEFKEFFSEPTFPN